MRIEDWDAKLHEYLQQSQSLAFEWGQNDCATWAAKFVDIITQSNHAVSWIGQYTTKHEAQDYMTLRGFSNPEAIADSILDEKPIKLANRGDLLLFNGALGICEGRRAWFLTEIKGLVCVPTVACQKAWGA